MRRYSAVSFTVMSSGAARSAIWLVEWTEKFGALENKNESLNLDNSRFVYKSHHYKVFSGFGRNTDFR